MHKTIPAALTEAQLDPEPRVRIILRQLRRLLCGHPSLPILDSLSG
jgi:hypothetical protein